MPDYRRAKIMGATYFITIVTLERKPLFLDPVCRKILHDSWLNVSSRFPFSTDAICLLPDHIHFLLTLPENDSDFPIRIREIKRLFSRDYLRLVGTDGIRNESRKRKHEAAVWQRRYWEHMIRNEKDLHHHLDYIHYNPVKHGLVTKAADWKWSSFYRYVESGFYSTDWGGTDIQIKGEKFGE